MKNDVNNLWCSSHIFSVPDHHAVEKRTHDYAIKFKWKCILLFYVLHHNLPCIMRSFFSWIIWWCKKVDYFERETWCGTLCGSRQRILLQSLIIQPQRREKNDVYEGKDVEGKLGKIASCNNNFKANKAWKIKKW